MNTDTDKNKASAGAESAQVLNEKIKQAKSLGFEITSQDRDEQMLEKRLDAFLAKKKAEPSKA